MFTQTLNGSWKFRQPGTTDWLPAQVPGSVHTDLFALERIPDPFVGDNELSVQWVAESDWEYQKIFFLEPGLLEEQHIFLVCEGIDTLADIYINGNFLGHTDNMFRLWEWDVSQFIKPGENALLVVFNAPVEFIRQRQAQLPLIGGGDIPGGPHLRKAPCHWGWDWGPKLPPIGLWKDISLEGRSEARFGNVHLRQAILSQMAQVKVDIDAQTWSQKGFQAGFAVTSPSGEVFSSEAPLVEISTDAQTIALQVQIPDAQLWWPNGYGTQPLYKVEVWLKAGDQLLDFRSYQIGLRLLELRQEPDEWGKSFTFYVNGIPIFAKGADWIPADSFPTRLTPDHLENLINSAIQANMNMLRVWGGGYYPEDSFYELCDRYGILVWQDFMFACGIYPSDMAFNENFRQEAIENIRRLRHHASLAIWCGNNEMEQGWCDWGWNWPGEPVNQRLKQGYDKIFHHMLPELLANEDPDHPYWPSSASSGTPFESPNGQEQGDCHYWDVWHGRKPFTAYRSQYPRFMSEFGFQALPPLKTIATYADPADWNMTSYIMEHHQRSGSGNGLMIAQMTDTFRMPKDFSSLVYLSMILQGEGIRYGVEHWRRNRQRVSGTLIWQLNDCWPVASWSSLDYFGRWKALHYLARRFYAPLLLSVEDTGKVMQMHVTSDLVNPWDGLIRWRLEELEGNVLESGEEAVHLPGLHDTRIAAIDFSTNVHAGNQRRVVFIAELWNRISTGGVTDQNQLVSRCLVPFVANKHLALTDPELALQIGLQENVLEIAVSAKSLARFVELEFDGADVVFSDNYFDLPAGQITKITCALPAQWTLAQAQASLRARSLFNSY